MWSAQLEKPSLPGPNAWPQCEQMTFAKRGPSLSSERSASSSASSAIACTMMFITRSPSASGDSRNAACSARPCLACVTLCMPLTRSSNDSASIFAFRRSFAIAATVSARSASASTASLNCCNCRSDQNSAAGSVVGVSMAGPLHEVTLKRRLTVLRVADHGVRVHAAEVRAPAHAREVAAQQGDCCRARNELIDELDLGLRAPAGGVCVGHGVPLDLLSLRRVTVRQLYESA